MIIWNSFNQREAAQKSLRPTGLYSILSCVLNLFAWLAQVLVHASKKARPIGLEAKQSSSIAYCERLLSILWTSPTHHFKAGSTCSPSIGLVVLVALYEKGTTTRQTRASSTLHSGLFSLEFCPLWHFNFVTRYAKINLKPVSYVSVMNRRITATTYCLISKFLQFYGIFWIDFEENTWYLKEHF